MNALEVRHLVKRYRGAVASSSACSSPNGAGKATTVSILTTTLAPTSGRVWVGGSDVGDPTGLVFHSDAGTQAIWLFTMEGVVGV